MVAGLAGTASALASSARRSLPSRIDGAAEGRPGTVCLPVVTAGVVAASVEVGGIVVAGVEVGGVVVGGMVVAGVVAAGVVVGGMVAAGVVAGGMEVGGMVVTNVVAVIGFLRARRRDVKRPARRLASRAPRPRASVRLPRLTAADYPSNDAAYPVSGFVSRSKTRITMPL